MHIHPSNHPPIQPSIRMHNHILYNMCVCIYILRLPATTSSYQPGSIPITSEAITGYRAASPVIHYQQTWLLGVKPTMGPERGPLVRPLLD